MKASLDYTQSEQGHLRLEAENADEELYLKWLYDMPPLAFDYEDSDDLTIGFLGEVF